MSQTPITVTYSRETILTRIEGKIDTLQKEVTDLKEEVTAVRTELKEEITAVQTELKEEIASVRTELKEEIASVRTELKEEIASVRTELKEEVTAVRIDLKEEVTTVRTDLKLEIAGIKGDVQTLSEKVDGMNDRLKSVEGTQKNQVWALIVLLAGAIATAGFRTFFMGNTP